MTLFEKLRDYAARRATARALYTEMNRMSDAELMDLNLSRAKLIHMSRKQALAF